MSFDITKLPEGYVTVKFDTRLLIEKVYGKDVLESMEEYPYYDYSVDILNIYDLDITLDEDEYSNDIYLDYDDNVIDEEVIEEIERIARNAIESGSLLENEKAVWNALEQTIDNINSMYYEYQIDYPDTAKMNEEGERTQGLAFNGGEVKVDSYGETWAAGKAKGVRGCLVFSNATEIECYADIVHLINDSHVEYVYEVVDNETIQQFCQRRFLEILSNNDFEKEKIQSPDAWGWDKEAFLTDLRELSDEKGLRLHHSFPVTNPEEHARKERDKTPEGWLENRGLKPMPEKPLTLQDDFLARLESELSKEGSTDTRPFISDEELWNGEGSLQRKIVDYQLTPEQIDKVIENGKYLKKFYYYNGFYFNSSQIDKAIEKGKELDELFESARYNFTPSNIDKAIEKGKELDSLFEFVLSKFSPSNIDNAIEKGIALETLDLFAGRKLTPEQFDKLDQKLELSKEGTAIADTIKEAVSLMTIKKFNL